MKFYITLTVLAFTAGSLHAQIFVNQDASGSNDGSSWQNAYTDLQEALDNANVDDQLWIAAGTYVPTGPTPDSSHFVADKAVQIYGGFSGSETLRTERDWVVNSTVISGDINGDDTPGDFLNGRLDNAHHIFLINHSSGLCVIDGLLLSGGTTRLDTDYGSATTPEDLFPWGGGAMLVLGQAIVRNCTFQDNDGHSASSIKAYSDGTHTDEIVVEDCIFDSNNAYRSTLRINGMNNPIVRNCTFSNNIASEFGPALTIGNSNMTVEDCIFENNQCLDWAGAIAIYQNSYKLVTQQVVHIRRSIFNNNSATSFGGAIALQNFVSNTELHIENCDFTQNTANGSFGGGAIRVYTDSPDDVNLLFEVNQTTFAQNSSPVGGAVYCKSISDSLTLNISASSFTGNSASDKGGALNYYCGTTGAINTNVEGTIFQSNSADVEGGAVMINDRTTADFDNVLFDANTGNSTIYNEGDFTMLNVSMVNNQKGVSQTLSGECEFQNTILNNQSSNFVGSGNPSVVSKGGNISSDGSMSSLLTGYGIYNDLHNVDPLLDVSYVPVNGSPCVDAGNPEGVMTLVDLAGVDRVQGNAIDIGAYESPFMEIPPCSDEEAFSDNPLTSQGSSSTTINLAMDFPSFTISDLGQKLNGPVSKRYIDVVTVSYVNSAGVSITHGAYSGSDAPSVDIEILVSVQSLTVSIANGYAGSNKTVSAYLSAVTYCGTGTGCPDDDADGVCNVDDICPGGDDNIDTDGDGVPDYCDNCPNTANASQADSDGNGTGDACEPTGCSSPVTSSLSPNPLTHSGPGSDTASLNFGAGNYHTDITFTISGINQKTNGNPSKRYIEEVVIDVDGQFFAQYSGSQVSSADVSIPGPATLIEVTLYDSYDGDVQSGSMSIDFSSVSSCAGSSAPLGDWSDEVQTFDDGDLDVRLYPNPSTGIAYIEFTSEPGQGYVTVRDILGRSITQKEVWGDKIVEIDLRQYAAQQILFVTVEIEGKLLRTMKLIIVE
jgi:predicted outer membrane repeat protein